MNLDEFKKFMADKIFYYSDGRDFIKYSTRQLLSALIGFYQPNGILLSKIYELKDKKSYIKNVKENYTSKRNGKKYRQDFWHLPRWSITHNKSNYYVTYYSPKKVIRY